MSTRGAAAADVGLAGGGGGGSGGGGGGGRRGDGSRLGHTLRAAVLGLAVSAVAALSLLLLSLWPAQWDVTATRSHALSPRTRAVLDALAGPVRVVIAANVSAADRAASQRLSDVLGAFARQSDRLRVEVIDTASAGGVEAFDRLLAGLVEEERPHIDRARGAVADAAGQCRGLAEGMDGVIAAVGKIGELQVEAVGGLTTTQGQRVRASFAEQEAVLRVTQSGLRRAADEGERSIQGGVGAAGVAGLAAGRRALAVQLGGATRQLESLGQQADGIRRSPTGQGALSPGVRDAAGELARVVAPMRDRAARGALQLDALPPLRTLLVQEAVSQTQAALVIGPPAGPSEARAAADPKIRAIPIDELLPPPVRGEAVVDRRYRAEELLTAALSDLDAQQRPLVALVHAFAPLGEAFGFFGLAERSLRLRGVEVVEWPVAGGGQEPAAVAAARAAGRPIVHTIVGFDPGMVAGRGEQPDASLRAAALGDLVRVTESVLGAGGSALVMVPPSSLAARGAPDPLAQALERFGIAIDSARILLGEVGAGSLRVVQTETRVLDPMSEHPVAMAIEGLPLRLVAPVTLRLEAADESLGQVRTLGVIRVPARGGAWLEGEWPAQGYEPGGVRDAAPGAEPWVVMASAERAGPGVPGGRQRVLAIGNNEWMNDRALNQSEVVDGRPVSRTAGNAELWAASVLWLAGRDDQVVRGAAGEAVAIGVVPAIEPRRLVGLKWAVVLTPPIVVLLLGGVYGALRR